MIRRGRLANKRKHSIRSEGTSDRVQHYALATTTIFYDFLGGEVSHAVSVSFAAFIVPFVKGQIRLAGKEIMGCVGRISRRTARSVDDLIVFAIFLVVCSSLYQKLRRGPDSQSSEDHCTRRDVLFPGHIHFTSRGRNVSSVRKRKRIVIILHPLSTACLYLDRI